MVKAGVLKAGSKVAIVSLSSGMLGEEFCSHNLEIATRRLKEYGLEPVCMDNALKGVDYIKHHPEARAADLKAAFLDDSIDGIICAIGGDDTYRTIPYLMEDPEFREAVVRHPKIFTGFSDTTVNHFTLYKLGLQTFYGPSLIADIGDMGKDMLPYTKKAFEILLGLNQETSIVPSEVWYEERKDFSRASLGTERVSRPETHGYELLQGKSVFRGKLLGGCLESIYDMLTGTRYGNERQICEQYDIFPSKDEWAGKVLFIETSEEKPSPELFETMLLELKNRGLFDVIAGGIVGKPQGESYYNEYKDVLNRMLGDTNLSIVYNVNFGHGNPRCILPYGVEVEVDGENQVIRYLENLFT